ncbi:hypothetical protein SAY87_014773 [Trapa incisa]|uniref:Transcription repressor n=1 Tax=Trapa incisa TaxID=236973 RepID=A0AAN7GWM9_9MYRT|nr:hypothetical protein SAY87_014773 [Trapa incisa]
MRNGRRFKLSDMAPNVWFFYKLNDTSNRSAPSPSHLPNSKNSPSVPSFNTKKTLRYHHHASTPDLPRKSYHFNRRLPDKPRSPPLSKPVRIPANSRPKSASCHASSDSTWTRTEEDAGISSPELRLDRVLTPEPLANLDEKSFTGEPETAAKPNHSFESFPKFYLPPIITKPAKPKNHHNVEDEKPNNKGAGDGKCMRTSGRRCSVVSPSPRLRLKMVKSPRPTNRRLAQASAASVKKKLWRSMAVVKSSFDPKRDFRESMVEMIVEHNIKASKDLEELLACYLCLNTGEYHELIIEVFKQIWLDLAEAPIWSKPSAAGSRSREALD